MSGTQGAQQRAVRGINDFTETLLGAIRDQQAVGSDGKSTTNIVCSPLSVATALAIVMLGASGTTRDELTRVVTGITNDDVEHASLFHASMQVLSNLLTERNHSVESESRTLDSRWIDSRQVELTIANALWGDQAAHWQPRFVAAVAEQYGAELHEAAFTDDPELVRQAINHWVDGATKGRIPDILNRGAIDHLTRLVVVNAVYFKANWLSAFADGATKQASFITGNGPVEVPMMHQTEYLSYAIGSDWQAVELPYAFGELSLLAVMSKLETSPGGDDRVDHPPTLDELDAAMTSGRVDLSFPRFDITTATSLRQMLTQLGLETTFSAAADLSAMTTDETVGVSDVFHYAAISVDEHGTEAAAATALPVASGILPSEEPVELRFDRPFRFWLRDAPTGVVVFAGDVADPSA